MKATYDSDGDRVTVTEDARQQLYDASGYGEPLDGDAVALMPVEAAYLLRKGKLEDVDGDGYSGFLRHAVEDEAVLRVYADLRDRGYYLSVSDDEELYLYARGDHPANSSPETRVEAVDEDAAVEIGKLPSLLAVADDDGDVTYFSVEEEKPDGGYTPLDADVSVVAEEHGRGVGVSDSDALREARYGSTVGDDGEDAGDETLLLSPVEAAYLAKSGVLDPPDTDVDVDARRLAVYTDLRDRGVCPRTGFKFGADFRVYETPDDEHAALLVSAVEQDVRPSVVEVSRAVRLAHGVRKRMVFALVGDEKVEYVAVERERP